VVEISRLAALKLQSQVPAAKKAIERISIERQLLQMFGSGLRREDVAPLVEAAQRGIADEQAALKEIADDQDRIRKNLRETPKEAEVYATYLKKLSDQEKEIDALTAKQKALVATEFAARKKYEDYLAAIGD